MWILRQVYTRMKVGTTYIYIRIYIYIIETDTQVLYRTDGFRVRYFIEITVFKLFFYMQLKKNMYINTCRLFKLRETSSAT